MKLHLTATSERGKAITKSGNEYIELELKDENRQVIATIKVKYNQMTIWHGNNLDIRSYKNTSMVKPKTARECEHLEHL